jgi:acetyl esterase/lipase
VVLSIQYRRAPEHRLPAAIEDDVTFLSWLRVKADFAQTFVSGVSAGACANLGHNAVIQVASGKLVLDPVRVVRYVPFSAFFDSRRRA